MNLATFLAQAIRLEHEAEVIYRKSAAAMAAAQNPDAAEFFDEMAGYAHLHLKEIMQRAGVTDLSTTPSTGLPWADGAAPESMSAAVADIVDLDSAMVVALAAERGGVAFYEGAAAAADDAETRRLAADFAVEERGHVLALERYMGTKPY